MKICRRFLPLVALLVGAGSLFACELFSPPPQSPTSAPTEVTVTSVASAPLPPEPSASAAPKEPPEAHADAPGIESQGGPTRGRLPKAAINEGVQQGMPEIERCYLQGKKKKPGLRGRILVNFVIAPDGSVPYAASLEQGTDFPDNGVIDCVLHAFQTLRFAEPAGGRVVATYPLMLEPAPEAPPSP